MDLAKIGRYIAEKRKRTGLTQRQLADKLGKSDKSVSKWERGICLPDVSVYMELCEILGISVNEFLSGEDISESGVREKSDETLLQVTKDNYKSLSVYLSEYQSGKRVSHEKIAEISFNGTESTETGMIVIVPDFEKFSARLIVADNYAKYTTENPILDNIENREYYGKSVTSIDHTCPIDVGTEQGLAFLIYAENGLSMLPIQDISGDNVDTENDYMYYYSVEFAK